MSARVGAASAESCRKVTTVAASGLKSALFCAICVCTTCSQSKLQPQNCTFGNCLLQLLLVPCCVVGVCVCAMCVSDQSGAASIDQSEAASTAMLAGQPLGIWHIWSLQLLASSALCNMCV